MEGGQRWQGDGSVQTNEVVRDQVLRSCMHKNRYKLIGGRAVLLEGKGPGPAPFRLDLEERVEDMDP